MVAAARKYGRMVQVGSQSRSIAHKMTGHADAADGVIGNVYMARGLCFKRRAFDRPHAGSSPCLWVSIGISFVDRRRWCPFTKNQFLYNWHWFWDTGNGDIGNQGVHEMDIARWGLGVDLPRSVVASGAKYAYTDDQETPNTLIARFDYGDKELVFEVRGLQTGIEADLDAESPNCIGVLFYGDKGWMAVDANGYRISTGDPAKLSAQAKYEEPKKTDTGPHMTNFLAAVRSRKHEDLHADVDDRAALRRPVPSGEYQPSLRRPPAQLRSGEGTIQRRRSQSAGASGTSRAVCPSRFGLNALVAPQRADRIDMDGAAGWKVDRSDTNAYEQAADRQDRCQIVDRSIEQKRAESAIERHAEH